MTNIQKAAKKIGIEPDIIINSVSRLERTLCSRRESSHTEFWNMIRNYRPHIVDGLIALDLTEVNRATHNSGRGNYRALFDDSGNLQYIAIHTPSGGYKKIG